MRESGDFNMKKLLIAAALAALSTSAMAADIGARTYTKGPMVSPAYNWSGFYVVMLGLTK
jgi:outer membrane immunogenic protein